MNIWRRITRLTCARLLVAALVVLVSIGSSHAALARSQQGIATAALIGTPTKVVSYDDDDDDPYPAQIAVLVTSSPSATSQSEGIVTYTIKVTNRGRGHADNVHVTVPFEPSISKLLDVTFDSDNAWVIAVNDATVVFNTRKLDPRDILTATVRIQTLPNLPDGTPLARRTTFFFADDHGGGAGSANFPMVVSGSTDTDSTSYPLAVAPAAAPQGSTHTFSSSIFIPGEQVALWYTTASGEVKTIDDTYTADENGGVSVPFTTEGIAPGTYVFSLGGAWSGFIASGSFTVQ